MILAAQTFVSLAGAAVIAAVRECLSDGSSRAGQVLFSLTVSHYRTEPLPEATVENIGALLRKLPGSIVGAHDSPHGDVESRHWISCEAVCWLRVASASGTLLPLFWSVHPRDTFSERARLEPLDVI